MRESNKMIFGLERDLNMKSIVHFIIFATIILVCSLTAFAQSQKDCEPPDIFDYDDEHTLTVDAETLLEKPKCYDGKFVRTIGFYRYGFEISSLYCPDCEDKGVAWVNTENYYAAIKRCTSRKNFKKLYYKTGATLGVVVLGILKTRLGFDTQKAPKDIDTKQLSETIGGFGHMGAYDSEFSPICFEEVKEFSKFWMIDNENTKNQMKKWYEKTFEKY